jgi:hypothetical protein
MEFIAKKKNRETYDEYLNKITRIPKSNDQWIYDIIDGKSEQSKILYACESFLLVPDMRWRQYDLITLMHVLAIVYDEKLRSLRDIEQSHIQLLIEIRDKGLKILTQRYGLNENDINMFFHYPPSTYHLHIHFEHKDIKHNPKTLKRHHDLNTVIENIKQDALYYRGLMTIIPESKLQKSLGKLHYKSEPIHKNLRHKKSRFNLYESDNIDSKISNVPESKILDNSESIKSGDSESKILDNSKSIKSDDSESIKSDNSESKILDNPESIVSDVKKSHVSIKSKYLGAVFAELNLCCSECFSDQRLYDVYNNFRCNKLFDAYIDNLVVDIHYVEMRSDRINYNLTKNVIIRKYTFLLKINMSYYTIWSNCQNDCRLAKCDDDKCMCNVYSGDTKHVLVNDFENYCESFYDRITKLDASPLNDMRTIDEMDSYLTCASPLDCVTAILLYKPFSRVANDN